MFLSSFYVQSRSSFRYVVASCDRPLKDARWQAPVARSTMPTLVYLGFRGACSFALG